MQRNFFPPLGDPPPSSFLQQIDYISLGVPLELAKGTPEKKKKNFFALKHFLEPIYQIKKNMYSLILERGGVPTEVRENSLIFFLFFNEPFPYWACADLDMWLLAVTVGGGHVN